MVWESSRMRRMPSPTAVPPGSRVTSAGTPRPPSPSRPTNHPGFIGGVLYQKLRLRQGRGHLGRDVEPGFDGFDLAEPGARFGMFRHEQRAAVLIGQDRDFVGSDPPRQ